MSYTYTGTKGCGKTLDIVPVYYPGFASINPFVCGMILPMTDPIDSDGTVFDPIFCESCEILETEYLAKKLRTTLGL